eukprot:scaffold8114_cov89-Skeletonema_menzelii.AAC.1
MKGVTPTMLRCGYEESNANKSTNIRAITAHVPTDDKIKLVQEHPTARQRGGKRINICLRWMIRSN